MDEYIFKRIDDNSYPDIQKLYLESFRLKETLKVIRNKYDTSYTGIKNIGYLAFDKLNSPAAYYGVFPMVLSYDGKDILVAQSGDTMTAPDHRGKGLFVQLAQRAYQLAWEKEVKLVFGFPNENSFPGFKKKLNWEFHGIMQRFTIENQTIPLCEFCSKSATLTSLYIRYCQKILHPYLLPVTIENITHFSDPVSQSYIKKDIHFFRYKSKNPLIFHIHFNGFYLLIKPFPHLLIGSIGYFPSNRLNDFRATIKRLAVILGCRKTFISVSPNHWLHDYLLSLYKPEDTLPIGFLQHGLEIPLEKITFTLADYDTF